MKISRNHLAVIATASKDQYRQTLNAVKIWQTGGKTYSVATDSYCLTEVAESAQEGEEVTNDPIIIPLDTAKYALSLLKAHKNITHAEITKDTISVNGTTHKYEAIDAKFPDYSQIVPVGEDVKTIKVNPKILMQALEVFKNSDSVDIEVRGELEPVVLLTRTDRNSKLGLVMPLRG